MSAPANTASPSVIFTADRFGPVTGRQVEDHSPEAIMRVAVALARYDAIHVRTIRHDLMEAHCDLVMACGIASAGRPQLGGRILGPSGSGKTTAARRYRDAVEARGLHRDGERPVLIVPLDRACTSRRFFSSILRELGDGFYDKGTEETLQKRAYEALRRFGVRLLIVDEVQHLAFRSTERNHTTDTLKRVLDDGLCPLCLVGTDEGRTFLNSNPQLSNRLHPPCNLPPLLGNGSDRRILKDYVGQLDRAMVDSGLTSQLTALTDRHVAACLLAVSGGVLGRISNLVRAALAGALLRGADRIEICDLSAATASWAVEQDLIDYDPFRLGVRVASKKEK